MNVVAAVARGEQVVHHVALSGISAKKMFLFSLLADVKNRLMNYPALDNSPEWQKYPTINFCQWFHPRHQVG